MLSPTARKAACSCSTNRSIEGSAKAIGAMTHASKQIAIVLQRSIGAGRIWVTERTESSRVTHGTIDELSKRANGCTIVQSHYAPLEPEDQ
jgi:hypothetical protein